MNLLIVQGLIMIGVASVALIIYEAYDYLPESWRLQMTDVKTKVVAAVAFFAPDVLSFLANIPNLGLEDWAPSGWVNIGLKVAAAAAFITKLQAFWDTRLDAKGDM